MKSKFIKIIYNILLILFFGVILLTLLSILGIPRSNRIFVVETGSMEPSIPTGSLTFVSSANEYERGDVITFISRLEPGGPKNFVITHRIEEIQSKNGDTLYQTKGDANENVDPMLVNEIDVVGKVAFTIPYLGYVIGFAKTQMGFVLIIVIPAVVIIYSELMSLSKEFRKIGKESQKKGQKKSLQFNI